VPRHTWLGHYFQGQKVKGQGHQAALPTAVLASQAAAAVGVGTCGRRKLLLRCRQLGGARRFGAHGGGEGRGISCLFMSLQAVFNCCRRAADCRYRCCGLPVSIKSGANYWWVCPFDDRRLIFTSARLGRAELLMRVIRITRHLIALQPRLRQQQQQQQRRRQRRRRKWHVGKCDDRSSMQLLSSSSAGFYLQTFGPTGGVS